MTGGAGDDAYWVDSTGDSVTELAGGGTDAVNVYCIAEYTLPDNVENGYNGGIKLIGNSLDNVLSGYGTFDGGAGSDHYQGSWGGDTYLFSVGSGQDVVTDMQYRDWWDDPQVDTISFGANIAADQIWFQHVGNNLKLTLIGTLDTLTVDGWYLPPDTDNRMEQFTTLDGRLLLDSQVENLVQAMASFAPPAAGETTLPPAYQTALAPVIAANWH